MFSRDEEINAVILQYTRAEDEWSVFDFLDTRFYETFILRFARK